MKLCLMLVILTQKHLGQLLKKLLVLLLLNTEINTTKCPKAIKLFFLSRKAILQCRGLLADT